MNKNLYTGLENFKEQFKENLSFKQLLNLFGDLKVLEYRSIEQHDSILQYGVQDLIIEVQDKIKTNVNKILVLRIFDICKNSEIKVKLKYKQSSKGLILKPFSKINFINLKLRRETI